MKQLIVKISHLIPYGELALWIDNPDIVKITINYSDNKGLKNPRLIHIDAYHDIEGGDLNAILNACRKSITDGIVIKGSDTMYLNGIQSYKHDGFIIGKMILKLKEIEARYPELHFQIPKRATDIIEHYLRDPNNH